MKCLYILTREYKNELYVCCICYLHPVMEAACVCVNRYPMHKRIRHPVCTCVCISYKIQDASLITQSYMVSTANGPVSIVKAVVVVCVYAQLSLLFAQASWPWLMQHGIDVMV